MTHITRQPNPTKEACADVADYMATARLFRTADDFLDAVCGPSQRDAHVQRYRGQKWLRDWHAALDRADAAVAAEVEKMKAEWREVR